MQDAPSFVTPAPPPGFLPRPLLPRADRVLEALRAEWHRSLNPFVQPLVGWNPSNQNPPCTWAYVDCDAAHHIVKL